MSVDLARFIKYGQQCRTKAPRLQRPCFTGSRCRLNVNARFPMSVSHGITARNFTRADVSNTWPDYSCQCVAVLSAILQWAVIADDDEVYLYCFIGRFFCTSRQHTIMIVLC